MKFVIFYPGILERVDILWASSEVGDGLDEGDARLLVLFEDLKYCATHLGDPLSLKNFVSLLSQFEFLSAKDH